MNVCSEIQIFGLFYRLSDPIVTVFYYFPWLKIQDPVDLNYYTLVLIGLLIKKLDCPDSFLMLKLCLKIMEIFMDQTAILAIWHRDAESYTISSMYLEVLGYFLGTQRSGQMKPDLVRRGIFVLLKYVKRLADKRQNLHAFENWSSFIEKLFAFLHFVSKSGHHIPLQADIPLMAQAIIDLFEMLILFGRHLFLSNAGHLSLFLAYLQRQESSVSYLLRSSGYKGAILTDTCAFLAKQPSRGRGLQQVGSLTVSFNRILIIF
jgi:hypothetical protein